MSKRHFLDFEQPIAELETKIDELRYVQNESAVDISDEIVVLSFGRTIAEDRPEAIQQNAEVIRIYLGEDDEPAETGDAGQEAQAPC